VIARSQSHIAANTVHHFARQFKQSVGVTPHVYLTKKRGERAQEMLVQTDLSLAEIAIAVGLSRSRSPDSFPRMRLSSWSC
jgi:transcriptional regulator GlxA family with amidase domain